MVDPKDFQTKTYLEHRDNVGTGGRWVVALDIGYSSVKGMSKNSIYSFPSFAIKASPEAKIIGGSKPTDIQYKDENGNLWFVGDMAVSRLSQNDTTNSEEALYSRNRYNTPMFKVLARVGLALGMYSNEYGDPNGKSLALQTGLPPAYIKNDSKLLRRALEGHHQFMIKVGDDAWRNFTFDLSREDVSIMGQPMGSFFSALYKDDVKEIDNAIDFLNSNILIFDGGFGTLDTFEVRERQIDTMQTFDDLGMKAVIHRASELIYEKHDVDVSVSAMQNNLGTGYVKKFDEETVSTTKIPINDILEEANKEVCMNAISQIRQIYNNLIDIKYLLVTGGTGEAWINIIREFFAGMDGLEVIGANQNTDLPQIFSNVRGYYLYKVNKYLR